MHLRRLLCTSISFLLLSLPAACLDLPTLRVMTYNIRYDNPADSLDTWTYRKDFIAALIHYHAPDIVGIQEGLFHQVNDLENLLPGYRWCGQGRDDGKEAGEFSAIFYDKSRFIHLADSTFWLSPTSDKPSKGWDAVLNRIATWVELKDMASGREFFVFNTHFDHQGQTAREESARLLILEIHSIAKDKSVIVTGDFNSTDSELPYKIITAAGSGYVTHLFDTMNLSQAGHYGPLKTYSGFDVHKGIIGDRIDFIFVSGGAKVLRHATLSDFMSNEHFPSDHLPVITEILFP
jgi:endonuclease/exonuclease/phosphatase family metal-dependent hydrolase